MLYKDLAGKVAVITGGSKGIGNAIAEGDERKSKRGYTLTSLSLLLIVAGAITTSIF